MLERVSWFRANTDLALNQIDLYAKGFDSLPHCEAPEIVEPIPQHLHWQPECLSISEQRQYCSGRILGRELSSLSGMAYGTGFSKSLGSKVALSDAAV